MWALHPSHKLRIKSIVFFLTFSGRAHLPTHALHYYVQENKRNKHRTELDLVAGGVGVRNNMSLETFEKLKAHPCPTSQNRLKLLKVMNVNYLEHLHRYSICGPTK
jgi:hypothetical protein